MTDLHVHTSCSDGRISPEQAVERAIGLGMTAMALTDHDTVAGLERARHAAGTRIELVDGVELSAVEGTSPIHILGYGIDPSHQGLLDGLDQIRRDRHLRAEQMLARLVPMGARIDLAAVEQLAGGAPITRSHIARGLIECGFVKSSRDAFAEFLGNGCPAYVPQGTLSPVGAIELVHAAGGVAVYAHPGSTRRDEIVPSLAKAGLDGIEAVHPNHSSTVAEFYRRLAAKYHLITTGGSDSHWADYRYDLGLVTVSRSVLDDLVRAIGRRRGENAEVSLGVALAEPDHG
jgi:3',5'-nucleoside bisphosphate phosphatase